MARKMVFTPLAGHCRAGFVNSWHIAALKVLAEVDKRIHDHPEAGTETSKKGRFVQRLTVAVFPKTFLCEVVYSFTSRSIRWESFAWKVIPAAAPSSKP